MAMYLPRIDGNTLFIKFINTSGRLWSLRNSLRLRSIIFILGVLTFSAHSGWKLSIWHPQVISYSTVTLSLGLFPIQILQEVELLPCSEKSTDLKILHSFNFTSVCNNS